MCCVFVWIEFLPCLLKCFYWLLTIKDSCEKHLVVCTSLFEDAYSTTARNIGGIGESPLVMVDASVDEALVVPLRMSGVW